MGTHCLHGLGDVSRLQHHFHQRHVLFIHLWSHLGFHGFFHDVVHGQPQRHAGQGASPGGVTFGDRHGIQTTAFRIWRAQQHQQFIRLVTLGDAFDVFLTFQVKGTGSRSDKTVSGLQDHFRPSALRAGSKSTALHAITLS
jgi:hypothetical protein